MRGKVLIIVTASNKIELNDEHILRTGYNLLELSTMIENLESNSFKTVIASPNGETPFRDMLLEEFGDSEKKKTLIELLERREDINLPVALEDLTEEKLYSFEGVFISGGYGAIADLGENKEIARILSHFHKKNKPTAVISHGACALLSKKSKDSDWLYKDYDIACYPKKADIKNEKSILGGHLKYYIEDLLREEGAKVTLKKSTTFIVKDRELISAPYPESIQPLSNTFMASLDEYINNRQLIH